MPMEFNLKATDVVLEKYQIDLVKQCVLSQFNWSVRIVGEDRTKEAADLFDALYAAELKKAKNGKAFIATVITKNGSSMSLPYTDANALKYEMNNCLSELLLLAQKIVVDLSNK